MVRATLIHTHGIMEGEGYGMGISSIPITQGSACSGHEIGQAYYPYIVHLRVICMWQVRY